MLKENESIENKRNMAELGFRKVNNKRFEATKDRKTILKTYADILFKEDAKIEFCRLEKCRIDTKRG